MIGPHETTTLPAPTSVAPETGSRWLDRDGIGALRRALLATALALQGAAMGLPALLRRPTTITAYFFDGDVLWLTGIAAAMAALALVPAPAFFARWAGWDLPRSRMPIALALCLVALGGSATVHHGIALSYDEAMAAFDAQVFLGGRLIAPLAPEWRSSLSALTTSFVLPVPGNAAWVSSYLPVNAAIRALFGLIGMPALAGPALAGLAIVAIVGIARRLWPERPDAALVAALMLATAPQVVVTAMTPYAMTAHLASNLVWLWCFLRGGRLGHGGAIVTGFLACGLHQVVFHPLFAAPFLIGLVAARRWRTAALYAAAYALIGAFWTLYWQGLLLATGYAGQGGAVGGGFMIERITALLRDFEWRGLDVMAMNGVRFVAWQSPLLLPLAVLAWPAIRRGEGLARPLAAGLLLTLAAMFVLLPYQGHGWGYRYLHGLIGSACLLGAQGWVRLTGPMDPRRRNAAAATLGLGWAMACLLLIPGRALEAERLTAPYATALDAIARTPADIVLVDDSAIVYGLDLVRNDPYLRGGPTVLLLRRVAASKLAELCAHHTIALFAQAQAARLGIARGDSASDRTRPDGARTALPCTAASVIVP